MFGDENRAGTGRNQRRRDIGREGDMGQLHGLVIDAGRLRQGNEGSRSTRRVMQSRIGLALPQSRLSILGQH